MTDVDLNKGIKYIFQKGHAILILTSRVWD